jgi:hypothetical protein
MFRTVLKTGACALGLVVLAGVTGCQPQSQNGSSSTTSTSMNWSSQGSDGGALVNQGRFPAPTYSQEAQPAYALTGDNNNAREAWATLGNYYQVGNARVSFPAAP